MKEEIKKELLKNMDDLKDDMNDISKYFVGSYSLTSNGYICDLFSEFADSETSIYYSDQREFYYNNTEMCEDALLNYGYDLNELLKEGNSLDDLICRAGAIGQYYDNTNKLYENEEKIILYLALEYVINNDIEIDFESLEYLCKGYDSNNRFDDIEDELDDFKKISDGE